MSIKVLVQTQIHDILASVNRFRKKIRRLDIASTIATFIAHSISINSITVTLSMRTFQSYLDSPPHSLVSSSLSSSSLSSSITPLLFHNRLKPTFSTNPSLLNTSSTLDCFYDHGIGPDLPCFSIYF